MPRPYSVGLRERVLRAHEAGEGNQRVLAARFGISVGAVCTWLLSARCDGRRGPRLHSGGRAALNGADLQVLARLLMEPERCNVGPVWRPPGRVHGCAGECCGVEPHLGPVGAAAKKTLHASEQERADVAAARDTWRTQVYAGMDWATLVFIDESGVDTTMTPRFAQSLCGQRALGRAPGGHWKRLTILGALAVDGLVATMTAASATTAAVFGAFVEQVLLPALRARPNSTVVMDNLAPHKAACVRDTLDAAGVGYRYLPPYSPDLNPIELAWSKPLWCINPRTRWSGQGRAAPVLTATPGCHLAVQGQR